MRGREQKKFIVNYSWKAVQDQIIIPAYVEPKTDLKTRAIVPHEVISDDETRLNLTVQPMEVVCLGVSAR